MKFSLIKKLSLSTSACFMTAGLILNSNLALAFGIAAKGTFKTYGQPVHETITQKAALDSGLLTSAQELEMKHLIEGVRFNDDPEAYLLEGARQDGGGVISFALEFLGSKKDKTDPTKASHFGDYQFLHAMGNSDMGAEEIKEKIILYVYHCWKMATEKDSLANFTKDYELVLQQEKSPSPDVKYTRDQIIVRRAVNLFPKEVLFFHSVTQAQFQYRALGSLLHVIQDSYAKGHVVRVGWESGANDGKVLYFQNYTEQDSNEHNHLDNHDHGKVNHQNVNDIPGAVIAYERSKQMLSMIVNQCPWTSGTLGNSPTCAQSVYNFLDKEIFAFDESTDWKSRGTRSHPDLIPKPVQPDPYGASGG